MRLLVAVALSCAAAATVARAQEPRAPRHELRFRIDPKSSSFQCTDKVGGLTAEFTGPIKEGQVLDRGFFAPQKVPCTYDLTIEVPAPYHAVSIGERIAEGGGKFHFRCSTPVDRVAIVFGRWKVEEEVIDGVRCRALFKERSSAVLAELREAIPRYQNLFGALPDGRFDVVEVNAKSAPFANLAPVESAGYLGDPLVRCWLGNHLLDRDGACEALARYFGTYRLARRDGFDTSIRRSACYHSSLHADDRPLREARVAPGEPWPKSWMVLAMFARRFGDDKLGIAVRNLIEKRRGTPIGWNDLVAALDAAPAGKGAADWFEPWLARAGGPHLRIGQLKVAGTSIVGTLLQTQEGGAYDLLVPVRVTTDEGVEPHFVACASKETVFSLGARAAPKLVEVDPEFRLFRLVDRKHVPPSLDAVATAEKRVGFGDAELLERLDIATIEPALPKDAAVLAVGLDGLDAKLREALARGAQRQDPTLRIREGSFEFRGKVYDQPGDGILFSFSRPGAPPVTLFHGNDRRAFAILKNLEPTLAGWEIYRDGKYHDGWGQHEGDRLNRAEITKARMGEPEPLVRDLWWLSHEVHQGRRAGSMEAYKLANHLRGRLHRIGLHVLSWPPVTFFTGKCDGPRRVTLLDGEKKTVLEKSFYPFHLTGAPRRPAVFERVVEHPAEDPKGALVLLPESADDAIARDYEKKGAAAVAVVASDGKLSERGGQAAWQDALPPSVAKRAGADPARAVSVWMAGSKGRMLGVPYLYLPPATAKALRAHGKSGVIEFEVDRAPSQTSNIVGVLGKGRKPPVLLSAHWDGVGFVDGVPAPGASDAAGVAAALWAIERLKRDHDAGRLRRPVVLALFGANRMGLWGSRQLAREVLRPTSPISRPLAAVDLDAIGSGGRGTLRVEGASDLREAFFRALKKSTLRLEGPAADVPGDWDGGPEVTDDRPLRAAGVAAVSVSDFAAGARDRPTDTLHHVDVGAVRETAKTVYRVVRELASR